MKSVVEIAPDKQSARLKFAGSMDSHTMAEVSTVFTDVLEQGIYTLEVDMREVDYLSSACIGVLIQAQNDAQTNGGEVKLLHIQTGVRRTLELMGLFHMMSAPAE